MWPPRGTRSSGEKHVAGPRRVEYLDNLLGGVVRKRVLPILEDTPITEKARYANLVLKSRPRDIEDTLAQLVHDDDPVVVAAAIHFVVGRPLGTWPTISSSCARIVTRIARSWRRHRGRSPGAARGGASERCRALASRGRVVDRLSRIPLFEFVSVDELFRITSLGLGKPSSRRSRAARRRCVDRARRVPDRGSGTGNRRRRSIERPSRPVGLRARRGPAGCADGSYGSSDRARRQFQGSIRGFHDDDFGQRVAGAGPVPNARGRPVGPSRPPRPRRSGSPPVGAVAGSTAAACGPGAPFASEHPLLVRATAAQLLAIVGAAREVPLVQGQVLFHPDTAASLYLVLDGTLLLQASDGTVAPVASGTVIDVAETLAGAPTRWRATVTESGRFYASGGRSCSPC